MSEGGYPQEKHPKDASPVDAFYLEELELDLPDPVEECRKRIRARRRRVQASLQKAMEQDEQRRSQQEEAHEARLRRIMTERWQRRRQEAALCRKAAKKEQEYVKVLGRGPQMMRRQETRMMALQERQKAQADAFTADAAYLARLAVMESRGKPRPGEMHLPSLRQVLPSIRTSRSTPSFPEVPRQRLSYVQSQGASTYGPRERWRLDVCLASGKSAQVELPPESSVRELKVEAQRQLQLQFLKLLAGERPLRLGWTLRQAGLRCGETVLAVVEPVRVAASEGAFAVYNSNAVVSWGDPAKGGDSSGVKEKLIHVRQIEATFGAFAAILEDGTVVAWGDPASGGDCSMVRERLKDVRQIRGTRRAFAALDGSGSVVTWGDPDFGGDCREVQARLQGVQQISATGGAFAAVLEQGVVVWGQQDAGGDISAVQSQLGGQVRQIEQTFRAFAALLVEGTVVTWGDDDGVKSSEVQHELKQVRQISSTDTAFAALREDGAVITWGGRVTGGDSHSVQDQLKKVQQIQGSRHVFVAFLEDGSTVAWGWFGLGYGDLQPHLTAVKCLQATAGAFAAVRQDGRVLTWGHLGSESVPELSQVESVHATHGAFVAIGEAIVAWGPADFGGDCSQVCHQFADL
ncbi:unnamed protein product [Effrenium voratum]|nr:unnamed protein product [Effrenium voratum]